MASRMDVLYERAKPSRGSVEHQQLKAELGGVEPGPDHPRYEDFIRLTDPKPLGRPAGIAEQAPRNREYPPRQEPAVARQRATEWTRKYRQTTQTPEQRQRNIDRGRERLQEQRADRQRALQQRLQPSQRQDAARAHIDELRGQGFIVGPEEEQRMLEQARQPRRYGAAEEALQRADAAEWDDGARTAATKAKKPAKPRKPEEVWYDVHKHPAGVPGGMGKSPEHHLRNRGWNGHEINEGSGKKTIQYRNHDFPDFVISYGGGSPQKPDHNFRVLYMGTNRNIPKVHRSYSVAEAMNKVQELHRLQSGYTVQPMTAVQAAATPPPTVLDPPPTHKPRRFVAPHQPPKPAMTGVGLPIGHTNDLDYNQDQASNGIETEPNPGPQLQQIPKAPAPTQQGQFSRKPKKSAYEVAQQATWEEA